MESRKTYKEKWTDSWFRNLPVKGKLLFNFLIDNCDEAGFYDLDYGIMGQLLGEDFSTRKDIVYYLGIIKKCFVPNIKKKRIWIKNFLFHQEMLPLNSEDMVHSRIIIRLEKNLEDFNNNIDIQFILDRVESRKTKKTGASRFKKPSKEELRKYANDYCISKQWEFYSDDWADNLHDHYETRNWKPKGYSVQMKDWKAAVRSALKRQFDRLSKGDGRQGRISKLEKANENLDGINYDELTEK